MLTIQNEDYTFHPFHLGLKCLRYSTFISFVYYDLMLTRHSFHGLMLENLPRQPTATTSVLRSKRLDSTGRDSTLESSLNTTTLTFRDSHARTTRRPSVTCSLDVPSVASTSEVLLTKTDLKHHASATRPRASLSRSSRSPLMRIPRLSSSTICLTDLSASRRSPAARTEALSRTPSVVEPRRSRSACQRSLPQRSHAVSSSTTSSSTANHLQSSHLSQPLQPSHLSLNQLQPHHQLHLHLLQPRLRIFQ